MRRLLLVTAVLSVSLGATLASPSLARAQETGLQEIVRGTYIDGEVGILTFLAGDGAIAYRPGMVVGIRVGRDFKDWSFYGKIGAGITGTTSYWTKPSSCPSSSQFCRDIKEKFGLTAKAVRQGTSILFGGGAKYTVLRVDERLGFHVGAEILGQIIPPDYTGSMQDSRAEAVENISFGVGGGLGFGFQYVFIQRHFAVNADVKGFFFYNEFYPSRILGLALIASISLQYTF